MFANKCAGGSAASLRMLFGLLDLPMPVSNNVYTMYVQEIEKQAKLQVEDSMTRARKEVHDFYCAKSDSDSDVIDVLVSRDGTWQ